ncbi:MAG: insulinase family protein [Muribaculaceae bacterium]|nr:insulinase family protein [Muribaculaceae bacterium]
MTRKVLSIAMFFIGILCMSAQAPQLTPLPLNPKVKSGKLPNGLSYYIMHNEEPKERANFYIAQKVGSTLETEDQLGLAHFLEHMAFNGTTHYPGKSMLNYLQGKGIRFGADINAYTAFDETVYNINNVPTTDKALMDSVLLVLHDWSGDILLEEAEIDAERGVIQEEWRTRNDASFRMYTSILPKIYEEYQYEQMPIGKMEVVMNFKPEVLRAYYKKWYRPDQQGIVIVGDFDADEMEKKVVDLFSAIKMPENAAERVYPSVSDNVEPIYASFSDPELRMPRTTISFKSDKVPFEMRNTVEVYVNEGILKNIISSLINNRITEASHSPECKYANAGVYFGDFYVSKTKDSFNVAVIPKGGTKDAVAEVMGIVARACKTGFTESELDRVREEILASYENMYNEREKTDNNAFGSELCRFFIDNEPAPGIEKEYEIVKQVLPVIPVQAINQVVATLLTPENMVVVTSEPQKEGFEIVAEDVMIKTVKDAMNAEYEAYVDEVITDPLIASLPTPKAITKDAVEIAFGAYEFVLPNGVRVVVKPTDFAADEVIMTAFRNGGKQSFSKDQAANVLLMDLAFSSSKMGPFDSKTLGKYLAGKKAGVGFSVNNYTDVLSGYSTVKDLPTLMELVYTSFTNLNADKSTYDVNVQKIYTSLKNAETNPQRIFSNALKTTKYPGNPLMHNLGLAELETADYDTMLGMLHSALGNAADYTFIFTGNVDVNTLKPLLEQYIATLPSSKPEKSVVKTPIELVKGEVKNDFKQPMQAPATFVYDIYGDSNVPFNMKNYVMVNMMGDILDNIFTNTLREEEGGTYGASVSAFLNPTTGMWNLEYYFQTNKDQQETLINRAQAEYMKLLNEGAPQEDFNKVKEAMLKQYEIQVRKNSYWDSNLMTYLRGHDMITDHRSAIESVSLDDLNKFMKGIYNGKNRVQVIMEGTPAE